MVQLDLNLDFGGSVHFSEFRLPLHVNLPLYLYHNIVVNAVFIYLHMHEEVEQLKEMACKLCKGECPIACCKKWSW